MAIKTPQKVFNAHLIFNSAGKFNCTSFICLSNLPNEYTSLTLRTLVAVAIHKIRGYVRILFLVFMSLGIIHVVDFAMCQKAPFTQIY